MKKAIILTMALFMIFSWRLTAGCQEQNRTYSNPDIWAELLRRAPYPYTLPLAPFQPTPIDGTYTKFEKKEGEPVHCLRCPDYAPEGEIWKLNLGKGVFRIFHRVTGWKDIGSFYVSGDRLILANDPVCHEVTGVYQWRLEERGFFVSVKQTETKPVVWIVDSQQWPRANLRALLIDRGFDAIGFIEFHQALAAWNDPDQPKPGILVLELHDLSPTDEELKALARLPIPLIALGGAVELNQDWIKEVKWRALIRRPVTIGQVAETIEKLLYASSSSSFPRPRKGKGKGDSP